MSSHLKHPRTGGRAQTAVLVEAEDDIHQSLKLLEGIVNTLSLPVEALKVILRVVFLLMRALAGINRAKEINRCDSSSGEE